ncbi:MAG: cob(I)yrinic acid a,c-diamide adenosyltransferase [Gemmatimonadota bacterium]|uniref:cob(I)yrinic acid a,c-diamide adenosyltransferase n=1 Tax=Candidatus Palauibacter scopulicola TaxID=3056741 RepID=UPI002389285D|nr:cob(I)yrinic acid a,c-diamide adenosyltransferase [Candidatus Palauibacter scopulicola]MDE2661842.1 cob(I)yrinic acid a,c-diamide adenosyltransferase [Candidatus Palauibacter scopulicola]
MKIYTKGGDGGETGLLGGARVPKDDARVAAYGTVDELNAAIGVALALDPAAATLRDSRPALRAVQEDLFTIGARLAAANPGRLLRKGTISALSADRIDALEAWIDALDAELPALEAFVLPGGSPLAAQLHVARTVCRRAERGVTALLDEQPDLAEVVVPYINRLSDLLFTLARATNRRAGRDDAMWLPQRQRDEAG